MEFGHVDLESLRLGLLKVKPSLRDLSFKGLLPLPRVMSGWSCVAVWSCQLLSVLRHIQRICRLAQATITCLKPCEPIQRILMTSTSNKNLSQTLWTYFVCLGTYSMNIRLIKKKLSHYSQLQRIFWLNTTLTPSATSIIEPQQISHPHLQQLQSQNLNNSHTFSNFNH